MRREYSWAEQHVHYEYGVSASGKKPYWVSRDAHNTAFESIISTTEVAIDEGLIDDLVVSARDGRTLYAAAQQVDKQAAIKAYRAEISRPLAQSDLDRSTENHDAIIALMAARRAPAEFRKSAEAILSQDLERLQNELQAHAPKPTPPKLPPDYSGSDFGGPGF